MRLALRAAASMVTLLAAQELHAADDYFQVVARIDLPDVAGRIDHLAYDAAGRRLFVAELGNNSVDVVDVASRSIKRHIGDLGEPQGIAWSSKLGLVYVASGDGTVKAFSGVDYSQVASQRLGGD